MNTTDMGSSNYQFKRLKDMLIADGDCDDEEEDFDGQKMKWKAYTLLRRQWRRIHRQKKRAEKVALAAANGGILPKTNEEIFKEK